MSATPQHRWFPWFTLGVGFLGGGLSGNVFTWWTHRPEATVVLYSESVGVLVNSAGGGVPGLVASLDGRPVQALYSHSLDFWSSSGPDVPALAIALPKGNSTVLAKSTKTSTSLHHMDCRDTSDSVVCDLEPVASHNGGRFTLNLITDAPELGQVVTSASNVDLIPAQNAGAVGSKPSSLVVASTVIIAGFLLAMLFCSMILMWISSRELFAAMERLRSIQRSQPQVPRPEAES